MDFDITQLPICSSFPMSVEEAQEPQIGTLLRKVSRKGAASMYLPSSGDRGVGLHEFGHALGLMHEPLNPLAPIQWNRQAVYEYYRRIAGWDKAMVDSNVLAVLQLDQSNYTLFDRNSIMIYEIPAELTLNDFRVQGNSVLSATDKKFIAEKYPKVVSS